MTRPRSRTDDEVDALCSNYLEAQKKLYAAEHPGCAPPDSLVEAWGASENRIRKAMYNKAGYNPFDSSPFLTDADKASEIRRYDRDGDDILKNAEAVVRRARGY